MQSDPKSPELTRQEKLKIRLRDLGPSLGSLAVIMSIAVLAFYLVWQTNDSEPVVSVGKDELNLVKEKSAPATQGTATGNAGQAAQQQQMQQSQLQQNAQNQPELPANNPAASDTQMSAEDAAKKAIESKLSSIDSQFSGLSSSEFKEADISDSALGL